MEKYRVETGSVYEFDKGQHAYIHIGKLNGSSLKNFIKEYEEEMLVASRENCCDDAMDLGDYEDLF